MMESKIKFIRHYVFYREDYFDVVYKTGQVRTCPLCDLPKTAALFLAYANRTDHHYDPVFKRDEVIYSFDEASAIEWLTEKSKGGKNNGEE